MSLTTKKDRKHEEQEQKIRQTNHLANPRVFLRPLDNHAHIDDVLSVFIVNDEWQYFGAYF